MRIVIIYTNDYGKKFLEHLKKTAPDSWQIIGYLFDTGVLPTVIDDPEECLPTDLPQGDFLLYVGQDRRVAEIISDMAGACRVKEVLAPVDDRLHLPSGLANQVKRRLSKMGIPVAFPAPFCSLTEQDSESSMIREFARHFGKPQLKLSIGEGRIKEAVVRRGTPCGNTQYVAERLAGLKVEESVEQTANFFHNHPCMGSMNMDREIGDTILHVAGHLIMDAVKNELNGAE